MSTANLHALTGAYALDALDARERQEFEAHLPACPDCAAEVASLRETAARLAAAEATTPPPGLREAVRDQVRRTVQVPPDEDERRARPRRTRLARVASWPLAAAAAAVAVVLAVGGTLLVQSQRADQAAQALQAEVMQIMSAPDMVSHDLGLGTHLVMSEDVGAAAVMGTEVPMPDRTGMVYQVWMKHGDGSMAPGPTFVPDAGKVTALVEGDLHDVTAFMVTEEPAGGSDEPSGSYLAELHL